LAGSIEQPSDLVGGVDVRHSTSSGRLPEGSSWGNLVACVFDAHPFGEAADRGESVPPLLDRRRFARPGECSRTADKRIVTQLGERSEVPEKAFLEPELEAELSVKLDVARDIVA
jgi:hypothetical protein